MACQKVSSMFLPESVSPNQGSIHPYCRPLFLSDGNLRRKTLCWKFCLKSFVQKFIEEQAGFKSEGSSQRGESKQTLPFDFLLQKDVQMFFVFIFCWTRFVCFLLRDIVCRCLLIMMVFLTLISRSRHLAAGINAKVMTTSLLVFCPLQDGNSDLTVSIGVSLQLVGCNVASIFWILIIN